MPLDDEPKYKCHLFTSMPPPYDEHARLQVGLPVMLLMQVKCHAYDILLLFMPLFVRRAYFTL